MCPPPLRCPRCPRCHPPPARRPRQASDGSDGSQRLSDIQCQCQGLRFGGATVAKNNPALRTSADPSLKSVISDKKTKQDCVSKRNPTHPVFLHVAAPATSCFLQRVQLICCVFVSPDVLCPNMKVQADRFKPNSTSYGLEEVPGMCKVPLILQKHAAKHHAWQSLNISCTPTLSLLKFDKPWKGYFIYLYIYANEYISCAEFQSNLIWTWKSFYFFCSCLVSQPIQFTLWCNYQKINALSERKACQILYDDNPPTWFRANSVICVSISCLLVMINHTEWLQLCTAHYKSELTNRCDG